MESSSVELLRVSGKWVVVVREAGQGSVRDFEIKVHAESYPAGQRVRMGLHSSPP